jgi:thioredoxin reductase (NADPH)
MIHKVIIIGSGPSGYTAAIYTGRAMLNPVLITGSTFGGQLMGTSDIENFPGFSSGISGPKLMEEFHKQAERFNTTFIIDDVISVNLTEQPFKVTTNKEELLCESIIVATGSQAKWLDLEGEDKLKSNGISTCAVCDANFFKNEEIIVVGGGDSAMEEAIYLTKYASKVTIIHRRDVFSASKIMIERAKNNPKINFKVFKQVSKWLVNKERLYGAILLDTKTNKEEEFNFSGAFICIGHKVSSDFIKGKVDMDENGYIIRKTNTMTSVPGVFSAGDVSDTLYKQAISAAGEGCKAALDCEKWLEFNNVKKD